MRITKSKAVVCWLGSAAFTFGLISATNVPALADPLLDLHTGDINDDGFRNVSDINCFTSAALANAQGTPNPACQAYEDDMVDMQCDGKIDVTDVQRTILIVLFVLTGDSEIQALLKVQDFDLDLLHNNCDPDDDNDGFLDTCEIAVGTNPLDPADFPQDPNACTCPGGCVIAGACTAPGIQNPLNECEACDPTLDPANWSALTGTVCSDGDACTVNDLCQAGTCAPGSPLLCDDGNVCTDETCDPAVGCVSTNNTGPCDDTNACTVGDVCANGACTPGADLSCDDSNPCTDDACDVLLGCQNVPNTAPCDDADPCTSGDVCSGGLCVGSLATDCNDNNPCTTDSCDAGGGCTNLPNSLPCDDGNACTVNDVCNAGACVPGAPAICDDGDPCTDDGCDVGVGCVTTPNTGAACDDGSACTNNDTCANGSCVGLAIVCDDGNECTDDTCDAAIGCQFAFNSAPCDDGNACTESDVCSAGTCTGIMANCDDNNICTDDSCDPAVGCVATPNTAACDDNNQCTTGDVCSGGGCVGGAPVVCDDGNECTDDDCDPATGCVNTPSAPKPCDDGSACTAGDVCVNGSCQGTAVDCDDSDP